MLTDLAIRALAPPAKGYAMFWDTNVPGLAVRVSQGGTKAFVLVRGRDRKKTTLGRVGELSLAKARQQAMTLLVTEKPTGAGEMSPSFPQALDTFLAAYRTRNRESTADETERLIRRHFSFDKPVADITTEDITKVIDEIAAISSRQHTFVAARSLFNWLVKRRIIPSSPMAGLDPPHRPQSRDRVLSAEELVRVWNACEGTFGTIVKLLILTGQRYGQIADLRSDWVSGDTIRWPREAMKGNRAHSIPIGPMACALLPKKEGRLFTGENADKAFTNYSNAKARLDAASGVAGFTIHDLRRTFASMWVAEGVPPHVIEAMLAHRGGVISGVAAIYMRHDFMVEMRKAQEAWEDHLKALLAAT